MYSLTNKFHLYLNREKYTQKDWLWEAVKREHSKSLLWPSETHTEIRELQHSLFICISSRCVPSISVMAYYTFREKHLFTAVSIVYLLFYLSQTSFGTPWAVSGHRFATFPLIDALALCKSLHWFQFVDFGSHGFWSHHFSENLRTWATSIKKESALKDLLL